MGWFWWKKSWNNASVLKGLVKKVAKSVEFLKEKWCDLGRGGVRAVGVLVEKWDAEDLDAWGQVVGWLKMRTRGLKS